MEKNGTETVELFEDIIDRVIKKVTFNFKRSERVRVGQLFEIVNYPFEVVLCDVLAELIRENEEIGSDEIAARYKNWLFEVLPVASRLAGCNLVYHGITDTDAEE